MKCVRVCGRDDKQGVIAGDYLAGAYGTSKITGVHDGQTYGRLAEITKAQLNKRGLSR
jgi:branched-chain amino acid transport system substrate-binding protein